MSAIIWILLEKSKFRIFVEMCMNTYRLRLVGEYSMGYDIVYHILCLVSDGYDKLSNH